MAFRNGPGPPKTIVRPRTRKPESTGSERNHFAPRNEAELIDRMLPADFSLAVKIYQIYNLVGEDSLCRTPSWLNFSSQFLHAVFLVRFCLRYHFIDIDGEPQIS